MSPAGLRDALLLWAQSTRSAPDRAAWYDAALEAMTAADASTYSEADVTILREQAIPLAARMERSRQIAAEFEAAAPAFSMARAGAPGGDGPLLPHLLAVAGREASPPPGVPARWEGSADAGRADMFETPAATVTDGTCSDATLSSALITESIHQAALNYLNLLFFFQPDVNRLIRMNPVDPVRLTLNRINNASLAPYMNGLEARLTAEVRALADANSDAQVTLVKDATLSAFRNVATDVWTAEQTREMDGDYPTWCRTQLYSRAPFSAFAYTQFAYLRICGSSVDHTNRILSVSEADLANILREYGPSLRAYVDKLTAVAGMSENADKAQRAIYRNPAGLAAALTQNPGCTSLAAQRYTAAVQSDADQRFWNNVILWGTVALSVAVIIATAGAAALPALGLVGAGTATAATIAGYVAIFSLTAASLTLLSAVYLGAQGAIRMSIAQADLLSVLVSGGDPERARADYEYGCQLLEGALMDGIFSIVDVTIAAHMLRQARAAGQAARSAQAADRVLSGVDEVADAILAGRHTSDFATPGARAADAELQAAMIQRARNGTLLPLSERAAVEGALDFDTSVARSLYTVELDDGRFVVGVSGGTQRDKNQVMNYLRAAIMDHVANPERFVLAPIDNASMTRVDAFAGAVPQAGAGTRLPRTCGEVHALSHVEHMQNLARMAGTNVPQVRGGTASWVEHIYYRDGSDVVAVDRQLHMTNNGSSHAAIIDMCPAEVHMLMDPCQNCQRYLPMYLQRVGVTDIPALH